MIRKSYVVLRAVMYVFGVSGLVLFTLGHNQAQSPLVKASTWCLLVSFFCFIVSSFFYILLRLRQPPAVPRRGSVLDEYRQKNHRNDRGNVEGTV